MSQPVLLTYLVNFAEVAELKSSNWSPAEL